MVIAILVVFGLCLGSFVNALVWRLHEQEEIRDKSLELGRKGKQKQSAQNLNSKLQELSILHGRSMCPHCEHTLASKDLIPLFSWLLLGGKCRYCHKPISWQYPLVELTTALLFIASYTWWPVQVHGVQVALFIIWLPILTGLMALTVYDLRWFLLPNRLIYLLSWLAGLYALLVIASADKPLIAFLDVVLAVIIGGGIFYLLFQLSDGKWIGGGDVRLGWLLGLLVATPGSAVLFIFLASILGTLISLPLLSSHRLKRTSVIPFGPFLIAGAVITQLFGNQLIHWYTHTLLLR